MTQRTGITIYGCTADETRLFEELAPSYGVTVHMTAAPPTETTAALSRGSRCVSVSHRSPLNGATLRALRRSGVRYISTRSIGSDHIDVPYAGSLGMCVETVEYSPDGVADYTLMLILLALRHGRSVISRVNVQDYRLPDMPGRELRDLTVGVIGTGRIGSAVVDRLRGFGCRVMAYDRRPAGGPRYVSLEALLRDSDIVTLHTPLDASTHHLLDGRRIAQMKPGALLVNTARGALVDTEALVSALQRGELGGAALDVVEGEEGVFYADWQQQPVPSQVLRRLHEMPNVLISPHTAYLTDHALHDIASNSLRNCLAFASKECAAWVG